jgi:subtilisin
MRQRLAAAGSTLLLGAALAIGANAPAATAAPSQSYVVMLKTSDRAGAVEAQIRSRPGVQMRHVFSHALAGFSASLTPAALDSLRSDPNVAGIVPNRTFHINSPDLRPDGASTAASAPKASTRKAGTPTADPPKASAPEARAAAGRVTPQAQTLPTGIDRIEGDKSAAKSGDGQGATDVTVAVIDTGIDSSHPDLTVDTAAGTSCVAGDDSPEDGNGHGTHVAGTIGAKDDADGVVGVAPGARLIPVRVLDANGSGTLDAVICGIDFVTEHAAEIQVANMSLGGPGTDSACGSNQDPMHEAICRSVQAGVTYAVSAGNGSSDASRATPAAYDEVITVSALADSDGQTGGAGPAPGCRADTDDTFADFSNFGEDVDVIAPGVCINSTAMGGGFEEFSGTSMASPHAAGAAALFKSANPDATPDQVKAALVESGGDDWDNGEDQDGVKEPLLNVSAEQS